MAQIETSYPIPAKSPLILDYVVVHDLVGGLEAVKRKQELQSNRDRASN